MTKPIDRVLEALAGHRIQPSGDSGKQWKCLCPAHEDKDPSMAVSVGKNDMVLLHCYAGCKAEDIVEKIGLRMADLRTDDGDRKVTVCDLAAAKKLPIDWLMKDFGLRDIPSGVGIPYYDEACKFVLMRRRIKLSGDQHTMQPKGVPLQAYGQWRLGAAKEAGELIIVEGESDAWTLWHHGFHAIGLPGVGATNSLDKKYLRGVRRLYVWQEHGAGGEKFASKLAGKLKKFGLLGVTKLLRHPDAKDPSAIHVADSDGFKASMRALMDAAPQLPEAVKGGNNSPRPKFTPGCVAEIAAGGGGSGSSGAAGGGGGGGPAGGGPSGQGNCANPQPPGFYALTDLGNAQRLVHRHGRNMKWVKPWKSWLCWDGGRWVADSESTVVRAACETARSIYAEAAGLDDDATRQRLVDHATASESARAIEAMVRLARSRPGVEIEPDVLDTDTWLLNCPNGTLDLRTGVLSPHRREDMITKRCATAYDPDAACPGWDRVVCQIFDGREAMTSYIRRLIGYCLTGDTSTHMLAVFWGGGGNGKGTLVNTLTKVIGRDYSGAAVGNLLTVNHGERHPVEIADLFGKRLVVCQETDYGCRLNESLVKHLTGGDALKARRMRENLWEFLPTHKLVLCTNYRPKVRGTDNGIWRRLRLVPFTVTFSGDKEDRGLATRLLGEAEGILAWAVRGCLEWQRDGEQVPDEVTLATTEYHEGENTVNRFLEEECVTFRDDRRILNQRIQSSALYEAYCAWADRAREFRVASADFTPSLVSMGFEKKKIGVIWIYGVRLRNTLPTGHATNTNGNGSNGGIELPLDLALLDD